MHTTTKRLIVLAVGLVAAASFVAPRTVVVEAGNPRGAYYSPDNTRVLWFVHTSDLHIGSGSAAADRLRWLVTTARTVIDPRFIVATGDLTDSTDGNIFGWPNGPYQDEWDEYKAILASAGAGPDFFYDVPGNHDAYNDRYFSYYLANSVQGRDKGTTQFSWTQALPSGETYHFLSVNTADNTGAAFSIWPPYYGDHAGLDSTELSFINAELANHASARLSLVFGHHPVTDTGGGTDTWLFYGHQAFISALDTYHASAYDYGHTHAYSQALFNGDSYTGLMSGDGIAYDNIASLGKSSSDSYSIVAIDCDGVSSVPATPGSWPIVLVTAPVDAVLGGAANPYAYSVPAAGTNPIRALVFDAATISKVEYRIDGGTTWYPMSRVVANPRLWAATWNASGLAAGSHTIEVRAVGTATTSHAITVNVAAANRAPVAAADNFTTTAGTRLTVAAPGVLGNDTDLDNDRLTAQLVTPTGNGTLSLAADGSFTYTPNAGHVGADSFDYAATDGSATSSPATVTITIEAQQDTVTITSAVYTRRTKKLAVKATSSQPGVVLRVSVDGGTEAAMKYSSKSKSYTYETVLPAAPRTVTVTSTAGGSATRSVTVK